MADRTEGSARCAHCSAALRPGAPWCTQCYAPTRAATDEPAGPPADVVGVADSVPAPRTPAAAPPDRPAPDGASWPCDACGARSPLAEACCTHCGAAFLAQARAARPVLVLPVVGDVAALTPVRLSALALTLLIGLLLTAVAGGALLT